jgi:alkylated DNA repair dioxygenase AlkB
MDQIEWDTPIKPEKGKAHLTRRTKWMAAPGCRCTYKYGGINFTGREDKTVIVKPVEFPDWMYQVMEEVMPLCGLEQRASWPNSCSLNRYSPAVGIDWHTDDTPLFQGMTRDCCVISLSLGSRRPFELRRATSDRYAPIDCRLQLNGGDLMTMEGMTQRYYHHWLPRTGQARLSLTWRWITAHEGKCPRRF